MTLAIFDLDNTLIAGDSDHSWGEFLVEKELVDANHYRSANDAFYEAKGRYSLFFTCNTWTNNALKICKQKAF